MKKHLCFSADFKFEVALAAVQGRKTLNELLTECGVHSIQISGRTRELLAGATAVFSRNMARQVREQEALSTELY